MYIGIDVGSVSTNLVGINNQNEVIFSYYARTNGQPLEIIKKSLEELNKSFDNKMKVGGVGTTGSGRQLVGVLVGTDIIKNEITAHAVATINYVPNVRTIFEIGGQDSKIILVKDKMVVDFAMNTVCAAGTGSFLDHQAERLGINIEDFGYLALSSKSNVRIAGRCTVFAESDMISKQQYGFSKEDIIKGLCEALVRNYINNLGRGKKLEPPFVFQGGVAANIGIKDAFEREVGHDVIVPRYYNVMGALGAAILAKEEIQNNNRVSNFRGFDCLEMNFTPSSFICNGCSNTCEVIKIEMESEPIAMWGDRCGTWQDKVRVKV